MGNKRKNNKKQQVKTTPTPTVAKSQAKVVKNNPKENKKEISESSISEKSVSDLSTENSGSSESRQKTAVPPHSIKVDPFNKVLNIRVTLTRIPPQFVEYHPTETHLVVHTLKYSKKFYLEKPFPEGIRVLAGEDSEAVYEAGVLTASLPIISEIPEPFVQVGKKRKIEAVTDSSNDDTESPKNKIQKTNEKKNKNSAKNTKQENAKNNNKNNKNQKEEKKELTADNKKSKKLPTPMVISESENPKKNNKKNKVAQSDASEATTEEPNNDRSEESTESKKPKQFTTKESAYSILESINSAQQEKINSKLSKEKAKIEWQEKRKVVQEKRKASKLEKKQKEIDEATEILQQKNKEKKAAKKEKVQKDLSVQDTEDSANEPSETNGEIKLKSIIKLAPSASATKKSVQFSPTLCQIKPIARVYNPVGPSLTLQRYQLRSQLQQLTQQKAPSKSKKNNKRAARRR